MINSFCFRPLNVPMHGFCVVSVVEKLIPSPHMIIIVNHIIIDGELFCTHPRRIPRNFSVFKKVLPYDFLCPSTSHLVLLKVKSFLLIHMVHKVILVNNNHTLKVLLNEVRIFLPEFLCCQSRGLQGPFCPSCVIMVLRIPTEKSHPLLANLQSRNLCAMVFVVSTIHK